MISLTYFPLQTCEISRQSIFHWIFFSVLLHYFRLFWNAKERKWSCIKLSKRCCSKPVKVTSPAAGNISLWGLDITHVATRVNKCFVCLFVWSYRPTRWRVERSSLPMRAENFDLWLALMAIQQQGSLTCHTYCDTGIPLIMVISRDTHTCCRAFGCVSVTSCFYDLGLSRPGIDPDLPHARRTLYLYTIITLL